MIPSFTYHDVRFADSSAVFARAVQLFKSKKVAEFQELPNGYRAIVLGTKPYRVEMSAKRIDYADCTCCMGQNDQLCKHMLALALQALYIYEQIDDTGAPIGASQFDPVDAPAHVAAGMRYLRSYGGGSKEWFAYQQKLAIGTSMITEAIQSIPASTKKTRCLVRHFAALRKIQDLDLRRSCVGGLRACRALGTIAT